MPSGRHPRRPLNPRLRWAAAVLVVGTVACGDSEPPALRIGEVVYTEGELGALGPEQRQRLALLTAFGVLVARSESHSLAELMAEDATRARALPLLAGELAVRRRGVSDDALRRAYLQDPEEELIVRHLVILSERWRSEELRQDARRKAEAALERIRAGERFAEVAAQVSEEPGAAESGGLLRPGREGDWVAEFWDAARRLREGEVSGVVETQFGFHVLTLEQRRAVPFEQVRSRVALEHIGVPAAQRALGEAGDSLAAEVRVDEDALERWRRGALHSDSAVARWPDGALTARHLDRYAMTLGAQEWERLRSADGEALAAVVTDVARRRRLQRLAEELGAVPPSEVRDELEDEWRQRVAGWAAALGVSPGMDGGEVRAAAMEGLVSERQSVAIARSEILERGPALRGLVAIEVSAPAAAGDGS